MMTVLDKMAENNVQPKGMQKVLDLILTHEG